MSVSGKSGPIAVPISTAHNQPAPGASTTPSSPPSWTVAAPPSQSRRVPQWSAAQAMKKPHGIVTAFSTAISAPAELSLQPRSTYASGSHEFSP